MHLGFINQDRYALKWIPEEKYKGSLMQWFTKGIVLTGFGIADSLESFYCKECEKIIIDTRNKENQIE